MGKSLQNIAIQKIVTLTAVILFIIKVIAWYLTSSIAILTDALESSINVITGFVGLYSLYLSSRPKDSNHPYGHGKIEFVSSAIEGTLIFVAGIIIIYESLNNFNHPHDIKQLDLGIILIGLSALVNFVIGKLAIKIGQNNNSLALQASGKHLLSDTYSTIGLILGLLCLYLFKYVWLDSLIALIFAFIIIYTGYKIIRQSLAGIMDEADQKLLSKLVFLLNDTRSTTWIDLHNLRIIKYGSKLHLDCHLTLPWYLNIEEAHREMDILESLVKEHFGESLELFVHTDACKDFSCRLCQVAECAVRKHAFQTKLTWTIENISTNSRHQLL